MLMNKEIFVISLGGSLIVPDEIDWKFLKDFRKLIVGQIRKNKRFVLITGGGRTCRKYQKAASKITKLTNDDRDWLGIHTTRLNGHLIKTIFRDYAHPKIVTNPLTNEKLGAHHKKYKILVAAGWRPGWSTDYVATMLADRLGAKTVINLSNVNYVYNKDPNKFRNAIKYKELKWSEFRKIVGNKWDPGLNAPFDPVASKLAQKQGLKVIVAEGKNIKNLKNILSGENYKGTTIIGF